MSGFSVYLAEARAYVQEVLDMEIILISSTNERIGRHGGFQLEIVDTNMFN